ncbi:MAG: hypothetical protein AAGA30_06855 [Planctomycetota bacterium]
MITATAFTSDPTLVGSASQSTPLSIHTKRADSYFVTITPEYIKEKSCLEEFGELWRYRGIAKVNIAFCGFDDESMAEAKKILSQDFAEIFSEKPQNDRNEAFLKVHRFDEIDTKIAEICDALISGSLISTVAVALPKLIGPNRQANHQLCGDY